MTKKTTSAPDELVGSNFVREVGETSPQELDFDCWKFTNYTLVCQNHLRIDGSFDSESTSDQET